MWRCKEKVCGQTCCRPGCSSPRGTTASAPSSCACWSNSTWRTASPWLPLLRACRCLPTGAPTWWTSSMDHSPIDQRNTIRLLTSWFDYYMRLQDYFLADIFLKLKRKTCSCRLFFNTFVSVMSHFARFFLNEIHKMGLEVLRRLIWSKVYVSVLKIFVRNKSQWVLGVSS